MKNSHNNTRRTTMKLALISITICIASLIVTMNYIAPLFVA
jgi:hypothetical protein